MRTPLPSLLLPHLPWPPPQTLGSAGLGDASWNKFQSIPASFFNFPTVQSGKQDHQTGQAWITCPTCQWQGELASDSFRVLERDEALPFTRCKGASDTGQLKEWHISITLSR